MAAKGVYTITEMFEDAICKYTGAPYCVSVDNASNALFLCLLYDRIKNMDKRGKPTAVIPSLTALQFLPSTPYSVRSIVVVPVKII